MVVRKKILYVHHGKGLGGAPISLLTLIKGLDFTKYQPLVIFLYESTAMELFKNAGIEVLGPINLSDFSHTEVYWFRWYHFHRALKALFESAKSFFVARQKLLDIKPDLIHLNTSTLTAWGLAAKQLNIPIIWHIRESLAAGYLGIRRQLNKKIIAYCASTIVPICKTDGRFWTKNKIVLYNPVDTTRFIPATKQEIPKKQYLLFLGGLSLQKGTNHMLRVFEQVFIKNPNTILIIAGEFHKPSKKILSPEQRSIHQAYALYEKLKNNIIITGPTQEVPSLIASASIVFFPAQIGHFARPVIEAGCMAKPVIASNFAQLQEIIKQGKTGFLLPPSDIEAWVETTLTLLKNPKKLLSMGNAHYAFCQKHFTLSVYAKKINTLYDRFFTLNNLCNKK